MAWITDSTFLDIVLAFIPIVYLFYWYNTSMFNYWKDRGVPFVKPIIFFGNLKDQVMMKKYIIEIHNDMYNELEGERFGGYFEFGNPILLVRDPALIERLLITDFSHFHDRSFPVSVQSGPLTSNLLHLEGQEWRNLRYKLNPAFTSGKLKAMFEQISNCAQNLNEHIDMYITRGEPMEAKCFTTYFSINIVASCAFGLEFKSGTQDGRKFKEMVYRLFPSSRLYMLHYVLVMLNKNLPECVRLQSIRKDVINFFINIAKATIKYREENNIKRNDFLQLMLTLRDQEISGRDTSEITDEDSLINQLKCTTEDKQALKKTKVFTEDCIVGQSFVFLGLGTDTGALSLTFAIYALATHPEIQARLHSEIDSVKSKHKTWNYQAIKDMVYLDLFIQEVHRMYPIGPPISRKCSTPYTIPGTDVTLEKGCRIIIPVYSLHHDPRYYPDPDVFNPDRFLGDNNHKPTIQPIPYLPFGHGPRMCIAIRFAILEIKVGLSRMLSEYSVTLNDKTQTPMKWDPRSLTPKISGGIWVNFHRRRNT